MRELKQIDSTGLFTITSLQVLQWSLVLGVVFCLQFLMMHHPYLGITETWRQGDGAAVARNFATESMNIFYPRIDIRGNLTGISGMEFPLYNFIVAVIYKITGMVWIGYAKMISILCSWAAVFYLYKITQQDSVLRNRISPTVFVLVCFSIPFMYLFMSVVMPEMFALALSMASFYYFNRCRESDVALKYLFISSCLLMAAMLVRPYYAFFGFGMLVEFFVNLKKSPIRALKIAIFGVLTLLPFIAWYHFWVPYLDKQYGMGGYFYMGAPIQDSIRNLPHTLFVLAKQIFQNFFMYVYAVFFGLAIYHYTKQCKHSFASMLAQPFIQLICIALLACIVLTLLVGSHYEHFYYLGAVFPAVAVAVSFAINVLLSNMKLNKKHAVRAFLGIIFIAGYFIALARATHLYRADHDFLLLLKQKSALLETVPKRALIVVDGTPDTSYIYLLGRKGWMLELSHNLAVRTQQLARLKKHGAQYLITAPHWNGKQQSLYTIRKL